MTPLPAREGLGVGGVLALRRLHRNGSRTGVIRRIGLKARPFQRAMECFRRGRTVNFGNFRARIGSSGTVA